jgi:hypothetical protein
VTRAGLSVIVVFLLKEHHMIHHEVHRTEPSVALRCAWLLAALIVTAFPCHASIEASGAGSIPAFGIGDVEIARSDEIAVTKVGDSVVDEKALTIDGGFGQAINGKSFQQDALASHKGYQYVGYYDATRRVCLARRRLPEGGWSLLRFEDYDFRSNDAHNTISIGICPRDGTVHLAFDHHGHMLHYRVSEKGTAIDPESALWEPSLFGPVLSELEIGKPIRITYPRFWQTPEGGLQFCYRQGGSGNGDRMLVDYDPETGTWKDTRMIDSREGLYKDVVGESGSRCSYPNGYDYGPGGKLHVTWVWRESSQGSNHDLCYAYSEDRGRTWLNSRGEQLVGPPRVDSPGVAVVKISRALGLMNTHGQAVDSKGRVHAVMWHCSNELLAAAGSKPAEHRWGPPEARRYHHYWHGGDGAWHHIELLGVSGSRPKLFMDKEDNAFLIFTDARHHEIGVRQGDLKVMAATAASGWEDWMVIHTEEGPFVNEMVGDLYRWKDEGVLSIMVQEMPAKPHDPTSLRIIDLVFENAHPNVPPERNK